MTLTQTQRYSLLIVNSVFADFTIHHLEQFFCSGLVKAAKSDFLPRKKKPTPKQLNSKNKIIIQNSNKMH